MDQSLDAPRSNGLPTIAPDAVDDVSPPSSHPSDDEVTDSDDYEYYYDESDDLDSSEPNSEHEREDRVLVDDAAWTGLIGTPITFVRPLVNGRTRLQVGREGWLQAPFALTPGRFVLLIRGENSAGQPLRREVVSNHAVVSIRTNGHPNQLFLPPTLEHAQSHSLATWSAELDDIRVHMEGRITPAQTKAIKTIAYVYAWFTRPLSSEDSRDVAALWRDLQVTLGLAAMMALRHRTGGATLIYNVRQWAQAEIEDALPPYLRQRRRYVSTSAPATPRGRTPRPHC
ncbi:hypothetical protein C2E23DRAFT_880995 [Lenzites betulinus]|nr:hypothetical protein C2E23DRAFT_880995 [Lenzites betulinus]